MAGRDVAASTRGLQPKSVARRLWRVARAVLYMLRRGVLRPTGRKLAMDVGLLLRRGKIAGGKVLAGGLLGFNHNQHSSGAFSSARSSSFSSCRSLDVHEPSARRSTTTRRDREVEFSCSNTPFSAAADRRRHYRDDAAGCFSSDAAEIAKVFEMLNLDDDDDAVALAMATPSPALWRTSSSAARQLRITDSPFEEQQVDRKADEFIRRFYEQLRAQKSTAATPDSYGYAASGSYAGHSPRPVAAGIA